MIIIHYIYFTYLSLGMFASSVSYQIPDERKFEQVIPVVAEKTSDSLSTALRLNLNPDLVKSFEERLPEFLSFATNKIVTLIDFSLPSYKKRLWTLNLETGDILLNTFVAHGRNSGNETAEKFSNTPESYQSSLGFYLTDQPYSGKHGQSLRLKGLEKNLNDKAFERAIVIHGADYVSESFIEKHGRLGRSHGCPAIPEDLTTTFINKTKDGSLIFIYHPSYKNQNL
jgi:hypothetical protein